MKKRSLIKLSIFALSSCLFVSCVDDKYDFDDVDMTIGTTGDLTLPTSSTGSILLKNLMDLKEDGVIQVIDGKYYLQEEGNADVPRIDITPITITKPVLSDITASISLDNILPARTTQSTRGISIGGITLPDLPELSYTYTIQDKDKAYYTLDNSVRGKVPAEVVDLKSVSFADNTTLDAKIQIILQEGYDFINKVHLDNLKITLPLGLHVSSAEFVHWTDNGSDIVLEEVEAIEINNETGLIHFTETDVNTIIDAEHEIHIRITFDKAVTGMGGFAFEGNEVSLSGMFKVDGSFRLESNDFDLERLNIDQIKEIIKTQSFDAIYPRDITFIGNAAFTQDISIKSFAGSVKSAIGDIAPIKLSDMPDFLNDPEVVLDLANPVFFVEVDNPLPADAKTAISLESRYTDGTAPVLKQSQEIAIPANAHSVLCIADHFDGIEIPAKYQGLQVVNVPIANLNELLKKLPDEIKVDVEDISMDIEEMTIPSQYDVKISYMVYTPLEFGDEFKLVYQGTEEGLADDLEDINKLDTKCIRITATAVTNFPLDLTLSVDLCDKKGKSIKGDLVKVNDLTLKAHKGSGATSSQDITLTIEPTEGHSIREALERLDKIVYRAEAQADVEGELLDNAHIQLTNIKITLVGGVSYDAN